MNLLPIVARSHHRVPITTVNSFTLIELLVVISIIGLLIALLLPALSRARELGRRAVCMSNAKQQGVAQMLYLEDNEQTFYPLYWSGDGGGLFSESSQVWMDAILPYLSKSNIYICPSRLEGTLTAAYVGYGFNWYYLGVLAVPQAPGYPGTQFHEIGDPSRTVLIADSKGRDDGSLGPYGNFIWSYQCNSEVYPLFTWRIYHTSDVHDDGTNVAWCDGHAEWMPHNTIGFDDTLWDLD